jgi:hypothetical protein
VNEAERTVQLLQKEVDKLEGMSDHQLIYLKFSIQIDNCTVSEAAGTIMIIQSILAGLARDF